MTVGSETSAGEKLRPAPELQRYTDGALAVRFYGRFGWQTLSVNIAGVSSKLQPGLFFVKTWSENQDLAQRAWASGLFEDMGVPMQTGFVEAPLWRFKNLPEA